MFVVEADRKHFVETDTDIFNFFSPIFGQWPIFDWPPISLFCQYCIQQSILIKIGVDYLQPDLRQPK